MEQERYDIPVVLFIFRRCDTLKRIIDRISLIKPIKVYVLSDQGRNEIEKEQVKLARETVEYLIDWPCEIIWNYAEENRGVYGNIGLGAKWVLEQEKWAIFLEDDNLPDVTFFDFCKKMLVKYEKSKEILWICGTNYLGKYRNSKNESYFFTRNLLPCGWASWSEKFMKYYDFNFASVRCEDDFDTIRDTYITKTLFIQERNSILSEYRNGINKGTYRSWDYHMLYSVRRNRMFGISPACNLIENIGVDAFSEHGGTSKKEIMTKRFCGVGAFPIESDLIDPKQIVIDKHFEKKIEKIITKPLKVRISTNIAIFLRKVFKIPDNVKVKVYFLEKRRVFKYAKWPITKNK